MELPSDIAQWREDTERLLIAGLSSGDLDIVNVVEDRCKELFGQVEGLKYYQNLLARLPSRKQELFPEIPLGE